MWHIVLFHYLLLWQWEVCYQQGRGNLEKLLLEIKLRDCVSQHLAASDGLYCPSVMEQIGPFQFELCSGGWDVTCSELVDLTADLTRQLLFSANI